MTSYKIYFQPVGRRGESLPENSLLDVARQMGVGLSGVQSHRGAFLVLSTCMVQVQVEFMFDNDESPAELAKLHINQARPYPEP